MTQSSSKGLLRDLATAVRWTWDDLRHAPLSMLLGLAAGLAVMVIVDDLLPTTGSPESDGSVGLALPLVFVFVFVPPRWPTRKDYRRSDLTPEEVHAVDQLIARGQVVEHPRLAPAAVERAQRITHRPASSWLIVPGSFLPLALLTYLLRDDDTGMEVHIAAGALVAISLAVCWAVVRGQRRARVTEISALDLLATAHSPVNGHS